MNYRGIPTNIRSGTQRKVQQTSPNTKTSESISFWKMPGSQKKRIKEKICILSSRKFWLMMPRRPFFTIPTNTASSTKTLSPYSQNSQNRRIFGKICCWCGCSSMAEHQFSKLDTRVRFPSPAQTLMFKGSSDIILLLLALSTLCLTYSKNITYRIN